MLKFFLVLIGFVVISDAITYHNYKVYNVVPKTQLEAQIVTDFWKSGYELWDDVVTVGRNVRVMVAPEKNEDFVSLANTIGLQVELRVPNVQKLIDDQMRPAQNVSRVTSNLGSFSWDRYHTLEEIHAWLDELPSLLPSVVSTITIGTSHEGRPIKGVIIDLHGGLEDLPVAMIEGGIHAREWISPATVTWIIKEFLTSDDREVQALAQSFIWHIFPVANPDGYTYTFSGDRMWRKNRNPLNYGTCTSGGSTDLSNGIDLNRNFDFVWMTTGASQNPCSNTYAGPSPSSELEAQAIINYVNQIRRDGNMIYYFAFHSFSQMILVPYSHVSGMDVLLAENYADMYEIAIRGAEKLEAKHGTHYTVGTSAEILYEVSGSSFDWVKGVANIPIVYLFELRDLGDFGFLLPPEQIIPNNEEIMECLLEIDRTTRLLGYYTRSTGANVYGGIFSLVVSIVLLVVAQ